MKVRVVGGDRGYNGGRGWSQMADLGEGNRFGRSASLEMARRHRKKPRKTAVAIEINDQKAIVGSNYGGAGGGDGYGSIAGCEEVTKPVRWSEEGRRLNGGKLKWLWH